MDTNLNTCRAGHDSHERICLDISLRGQPERVPDFPAIPERLAMDFKLNVFAAGKYMNTPEYCTGQDELSLSIETQGVWEGWITLLALDIFDKLWSFDKASVFVDFGSHVGWYSMIAALSGWDVHAYEADAENIELLQLNARANDVESQVAATHTWIDETLPKLAHATVIKVDLEGLDHHAVNACEGLFKSGTIKAALVEISPYLAEGIYPDLCRKIAGYGYSVHQIPDKGFAHKEAFEANPLGITRREEITDFDQVEQLRQENFLFFRKGTK